MLAAGKQHPILQQLPGWMPHSTTACLVSDLCLWEVMLRLKRTLPIKKHLSTFKCGAHLLFLKWWHVFQTDLTTVLKTILLIPQL